MTMSIYAQQAGLLGRANAVSPLDGPVLAGMPRGIGTEVNQCANRMKCVWDFAVLGGAAGDILLLDDQGNPAMLPLGAVVTGFSAYVISSALGGTSIAGKLLGAADLMAATVIASLTTGVVWNGKPISGGAGAAATVVGPVVAKLGSQVKITIAGTMTAGKICFYVDYIDGN